MNRQIQITQLIEEADSYVRSRLTELVQLDAPPATLHRFIKALTEIRLAANELTPKVEDAIDAQD